MKFAVLFIILLNNYCFSAEILSNWLAFTESERIQIQYRWILIGDTLKTREIRAVFKVTATHETLIHNIKDGEKAKQWLMGIKEYKTFGQTADSWFSYSLFNIPKPFEQQDLVSQYNICTDDGLKTVISIKASPSEYKNVANVSRLNDYCGKWVLFNTSDEKTLVEFYTISYTAPIFPRFIQDPIVKIIMLKSFERFIALAETNIH